MALTYIFQRYNHTILSQKIKYHNSIKRNLMRSVAGSAYARMTSATRVNASVLSKNLKANDTRNMTITAQKFQPVFAEKKSHDRDKQDISWHEGSHVILHDDITNKIVGLLTSAHGLNLPPGVYHAKVSSEKYDGSFIPLKGLDPTDPKKKIDLLDSEGNKIPDPNKGGQFLAVFPMQRILSSETRGYLMTKEEIQQKYPYLKTYMDKYQTRIQQLIAQGHAQNDATSKFSKKLGGKDDEPL